MGRINLEKIDEMYSNAISTEVKQPKVDLPKHYDINNPVHLYLMQNLDNDKSRKSEYLNLRQFAMYVFQDDNAFPDHIPWSKVTYQIVVMYSLFLKNKIIEVTESGIEKKLSPSTINNYLSVIKRVMRKASIIQDLDPIYVVDGKTYLEVCEIKRHRGSRVSEERTLSDKEILEFLRTCSKGSPKDLRDAAIFVTMINAGLRINEVTTMHYPDNIDIGIGQIRIIGKGNKERTIPMSEQLQEFMYDYIENIRGEAPGPLWARVWKNGDFDLSNGLSESGIRKILSSRYILGGLEKFKPHDLRKTFATILHNKGVGLKTIQELLGHSVITTTGRYILQTEQDKIEAIKKL